MPDDPLYRIFENTPFSPKYALKEYKGSGNFGAVFIADEVVSNRRIRSVALKAIRGDRGVSLDKAIAELQLATTLKHPYLVDCYTAEEGQLTQPQFPQMGAVACLGLVMEIASGTLTQHWEEQSRQLPASEVQEIICGIASALVYLHNHRNEQGKEAPIVHQDLKPDNILKVGEVFKLADLGVARTLDTRTAIYTSALGSEPYVPPEVFERRSISTAWDVWSLGIIIVELLTGQHPFAGGSDLVAEIIQGDPQIPASLPELFKPIVQGCLIKDRKQRWTAEQVLEALKPTALPVFQNYQERLPNGILLDMVAIPAGAFWMGSTPEQIAVARTDAQRYGVSEENADRWLSCEASRHLVQVPAFYLGQYPITQSQYEAVMGTNPAHFQGANCPVEQVSWEDATAFCQKLSQLTGRTYRLPTEAEWEYACRAGTTTPFYFGETITTNQVNYNGNYPYGNGEKGIYRERTTEVGSFPANAFGLFDMHGNVGEWCSDDWHDSYADKPEELKQNGSIVWTASNSKYKLLRGGSWGYVAWLCRSADRNWFHPGNRINSLGFRVCCSPQ